MDEDGKRPEIRRIISRWYIRRQARRVIEWGIVAGLTYLLTSGAWGDLASLFGF